MSCFFRRRKKKSEKHFSYQTEPSFLSKLRTPSADTAAVAPSQHPAIVADSVTSPCQISAPSFERRAATAEEEEVGAEEEEEVAAAFADDFASFLGLTKLPALDELLHDLAADVARRARDHDEREVTLRRSIVFRRWHRWQSIKRNRRFFAFLFFFSVEDSS